MKQFSAVRVTRSYIVPRFSCVAWMSRKHSSYPPRRVIGPCGIHRVAGIAQVDEIDALYDAAIGHVQAGDDAVLSMPPDCRPPARKASPARCRLGPPSPPPHQVHHDAQDDHAAPITATGRLNTQIHFRSDIP